MKIAVLISGEYRTFARCRPHMKFLDDPNVDVYFSTWNISRQENKLLNVLDEFLVDYDRVVRDLGSHPAACSIDEPVDNFNIAKMINRWKVGIDLIESSGVLYERIIIVRPDALITDAHITSIETSTADLLYGNTDTVDTASDILFAGEYAKVTRLITDLPLYETFTISVTSDDWHRVLYMHIAQYDLTTCILPLVIICRKDDQTSHFFNAVVWYASWPINLWLENKHNAVIDSGQFPADQIYGPIGHYLAGDYDEYLSAEYTGR